jgi:hypothetical protein
MGKPTYKSNPRVNQIFEDLEKLLEFCRDYGYIYNESDLYNMRSYVFRQYNKFATGKQPRNNWTEDTKA